MLSAPPSHDNNPSNDPAYLADDTGGRGSTIYILDTGFDVNAAVSVAHGFYSIY